MIMERMIFKMIIIVFLAIVKGFDVIAQDGFDIKSVCIVDEELVVIFINHSNQKVTVPSLSDRYDSEENRHLGKNYYEILGDTLVINISKIHPLGLIDSRGLKALNSSVEFDDKVLKPGRKFKSRIALDFDFEHLSILKLTYNNITVVKSICR